MASMWETHLDKVLSIVRSSRTYDDVAERCSELFGKPVTVNAVSAALRRLRRDKGVAVPQIGDILGTEQDSSPMSSSDYAQTWAVLRGADPWDEVNDTMVKLRKPKKSFDTLPAIKHLGWLPKRIAVIPDSHHPIHDPYAIDAMMAYLRDYKPDYIVLIGDVYDCLCLSRHANSHAAVRLMDIKYQLKTEIDAAKPFINELLSISNNNLAWIEGNHEYRRQNILNANPGLIGLPALDAKNLFEIPDKVWWIESDERLRIGNMFFEHGDQIINSRGSMHVANTMWNRRPNVNTFVGHWHCIDVKRRISYTDVGEAVTSVCATVGHLSTIKEHQHYAKLPNWSNGFATMDTWEKDGKCCFSLDIVEMSGYEFRRNGKLYSGRRLQ